MREIRTKEIISKVKEALILACEHVSDEVNDELKTSIVNESSPIGREIIKQIIENNSVAIANHLPACQDTGIVVCFLEVGFDVHFDSDIYEAINEGVRRAYQEGYLRKSVVSDPFKRNNTHDNTPAIIHTSLIPGDKVIISLIPKGAGSENVSFVKMLTPADGIKGVENLVLSMVRENGARACPPITIGIGVGGDLEKSALLAKQALLEPLHKTNDDAFLASLEEEIKEKVNKIGLGPMGLGGNTTCLGVKIKTYPCHIASLPVAVNVQCHACRHIKVVI